MYCGEDGWAHGHRLSRPRAHRPRVRPAGAGQGGRAGPRGSVPGTVRHAAPARDDTGRPVRQRADLSEPAVPGACRLPAGSDPPLTPEQNWIIERFFRTLRRSSDSNFVGFARPAGTDELIAGTTRRARTGAGAIAAHVSFGRTSDPVAVSEHYGTRRVSFSLVLAVQIYIEIERIERGTRCFCGGAARSFFGSGHFCDNTRQLITT